MTDIKSRNNISQFKFQIILCSSWDPRMQRPNKSQIFGVSGVRCYRDLTSHCRGFNQRSQSEPGWADREFDSPSGVSCTDIQGPILQNLFCQNTTAVKLRLDFDAWFEFVPVTLHYQFEAILILPICRCKYVIVWTHLAPQIMNQNRSISCSMANSVLKYCSQCRVNGDKLFPALHVGHRNAHDDQAVGFDRHSSGQLEGFKWGKLWSSLVKGDEQHCRHKW